MNMKHKSNKNNLRKGFKRWQKPKVFTLSSQETKSGPQQETAEITFGTLS